MSTERVLVPLRISPDLKAKLIELAARDGRSLNAFIGRALSRMVARFGPPEGEPVAVQESNAAAPPTLLPASSPPRVPRLAAPARMRNVPRNQPCPCGSRTKYKKCCGKP